MRPLSRGHAKTVLFLLSLSASALFFLQNILFTFSGNDGDRFKFGNVPQPTFAPIRGVTKSISELKKLAQVNNRVLIFNHVPNAGSEVFVLILQWLQGRNSFKHIRLRNKKSGKLTTEEQRNLSEEVSAVLMNLVVPLSFDSSTFYTNFTKYGWLLPTHFGIVRNPDSILNKYVYLTKNNSSISGNDLAIPYFCGHDDECSAMNSEWALARAKLNVERFYPVVGVLELLSETLLVLEKNLKYYFQGAQELYIERFKDKHEEWRKRISKDTFKNNRDSEGILATEYEFYNWIKSRLLSQMELLKRQSKIAEKSEHTKYHFQVEYP